jgi:hypothetical protein
MKKHELDECLKMVLLEMGKAGEPRPKAKTVLGRALNRFTTPEDPEVSKKRSTTKTVAKTMQKGVAHE